MNQAKEIKMLPVSFRADPDMLQMFSAYCDKAKTTRSELLRVIFNKHINTLKQQNELTQISIGSIKG